MNYDGHLAFDATNLAEILAIELTEGSLRRDWTAARTERSCVWDPGIRNSLPANPGRPLLVLVPDLCPAKFFIPMLIWGLIPQKIL